ncbi:MAG: T9SS C-terminal target domain-containing protein [Prevotella sp.]|nr:T9SS C-terminal target domain-containing protein [Prevotella sp.]
MRKIARLTLALLAFAATSAQAQEYNMFGASDVDADGWLWFDTQAKIDKYIGNIDETNYKVDGNGKLIQTVYADQMPDYPASEVSPEFVGAGTDGETGSEGSRTGAIMLQPSSASMTANGGGFVVCMPSCATFSICLSSNSKIMGRILATKNVAADMGQASPTTDLTASTGWKIVNASYMTIFKTLGRGIKTWTGIEDLDNGTDEVTIKSDEPIYVWFQSATHDTVYIHGIKVTTPKAEKTGINTLTSNVSSANKEIYSIDGSRIANGADERALRKGVYIIRTKEGTRKVAVMR